MKILLILFYVFSILGAVVGAGFMSGTEIFSFFARFGVVGYIGIAINCIIFVVFIISYHTKTAKHESLYGVRNQKNLILSLCQLMMCSSMLAGISEMISKYFSSTAVGNFIILFFFFIMLCLGVNGASMFNFIVSFCLVVIIPLVVGDAGINILKPTSASVFSVVFFAISYASMNIASSLPMIENVCKKTSKRELVSVSISFGIIMFILLFVMSGMSTYQANMPILSVIKRSWIVSTYSVLVLLAMISTLLSCGVGAKKIFDSLGNIPSSFFVSTLSLSISFLGFKFIISYIYPVIGLMVFVNFLLKIFGNIIHKFNKNFYL